MRSRTLWALIVAEAVSSTGGAMSFLALPWFVLQTSGPAHMSYVLAAEIVPMALFGIPSGVVIARIGARRAMLVCDAARAPLTALIPILYWTGHLSFGLLLGLVFAGGVFFAPYVSSQRSIIPEVFGDDETLVAKANGLFGGATQLPIVIGPSIAGALIAVFGTAPILLVDAGTFVFAFLVVLALVAGGKPVVHDDESRGVLAGVRYLMRDKLLGPVTLTLIVLDGAANGLVVAVPLLAFTRYHRDPHIAGAIFTGFGLGAIAGSVVVTKVVGRYSPIRIAATGMAMLTLPLWIIAAPVGWPVVAGAIVCAGVIVPFVNAPFMTLLSTRPPAALRAKVMTAVLTASGIGAPCGRLLVGPVYRAYGNGGVWVMIAGGISLGALLFIIAAWRGSARDAADVAAMTPVA